MWWAYLDASALIKRYSAESGTEVVNHLFRLLPLTRLTCSMMTTLEVAAILVRKRNDGRLSLTAYQQALIEFQAEVLVRHEMLLLSVNDALIEAALPFIEAHHLNATDTMILRSALDLREWLRRQGDDLLFVVADQRLARAARAEGLPMLDPERDTVAVLEEFLKQPTAK